MQILLLITVFLPLVGAILAEGDRARVRQIALATTVITFLLTVVLIVGRAGGPRGLDAAAQATHGVSGEFVVFNDASVGDPADSIPIRLTICLDGLSLWFFSLTAVLMIVAVLLGWEAIRQRSAAYYSLLLVLETGLLGTFVARDVVLFCIFFEFTAVPLFLLIGIWGGPQRRRAAVKFFLFAAAGSMANLLGLLAVVWCSYHQSGRLTFSIPELAAGLVDQPIGPDIAVLVCLALFAGFAIRMSLFPLHVWLPGAVGEAPSAASLILAGLLLNTGVYGFLRFNLSMLPDAAARCSPWLLCLFAVGAAYGASAAMFQKDVKRIVAFLCISHASLVGILFMSQLGMLSQSGMPSQLGMQGGLLQTLSFGLSACGLLALMEMLRQRYYTCQIEELTGVLRRTPRMAFFLVLFVLAGMGAPVLNGFAGNSRPLADLIQRAWSDAPVASSLQPRAIALMVVIGLLAAGWCLFRMTCRLLFGRKRRPNSPPSNDSARADDLSPRELLTLAPLALLVLWIALRPSFFLDRMEPTFDRLTNQATRAADSRDLGYSTPPDRPHPTGGLAGVD